MKLYAYAFCRHYPSLWIFRKYDLDALNLSVVRIFSLSTISRTNLADFLLKRAIPRRFFSERNYYALDKTGFAFQTNGMK